MVSFFRNAIIVQARVAIRSGESSCAVSTQGDMIMRFQQQVNECRIGRFLTKYRLPPITLSLPDAGR